jgi:hypothetical protein
MVDSMLHFVYLRVCDSSTIVIFHLHAYTQIFIFRKDRKINTLLVAELLYTNPITGQDPHPLLSKFHPIINPPKCRLRKTLVAYLSQPIRVHRPHHYSLLYTTFTAIQFQCSSLCNTPQLYTFFILISAHTFSSARFPAKFVTCYSFKYVNV